MYYILLFVYVNTLACQLGTVYLSPLYLQACCIYQRILLLLTQMFSTPGSSLSNSFLTRTL